MYVLGSAYDNYYVYEDRDEGPRTKQRDFRQPLDCDVSTDLYSASFSYIISSRQCRSGPAFRVTSPICWGPQAVGYDLGSQGTGQIDRNTDCLNTGDLGLAFRNTGVKCRALARELGVRFACQVKFGLFP